MGRVSVNLTRSVEKQVAESGKQPAELIELGLEYLAQQGSPRDRADRMTSWMKEDCTHPKARRQKGLCMACGTYIGA